MTDGGGGNQPVGPRAEPGLWDLGPAFDPLAPGGYEWRAIDVTITGEPDGPRHVKVYVCLWYDAHGKRVFNLAGDEAMRKFLFDGFEKLTGLVLPPSGPLPLPPNPGGA